MNKLKYHFLGGLVFLGTIVFGYIGYTTYTNLATQVDGATITKDIWNDVINTINSIGTKTDDLETKTSNIYQSGGNIGIGNIPAGPFHISTDIDAGANSPLDSSSLIIGDYKNYHLELDSNEIHAMSGLLVSNLYLNADGGNILFFSNSGTGNVGIGIASPSYTLQVNGTVAGTSWTATSDSRYKKDVKTLTGSLEKIDKLRGVEFKRKSDEYKNKGFDDKTHVGFIAQEVEKVYPEIVNTDKEGYKSVEYANITSILVEAVKELKKENEELKIRLDKLEK
ncbi:MAG: tail fiber domain-containing protein [Candidatus Gracilibacteria bacterium]|nr:tail fiber domain-containing protein [Candidatus Gracilibacteria bacterium]